MKNETNTEKHKNLISVALKKIMGKTEFDEITPITRGMSGATIYKVTVGRQFFVARFSGNNHWNEGKSSEFANIQIADNAEICPKLYYVDPESGFMFMKFIDAKPSMQAAEDKKNAPRLLARLVSRLHHCSKFNSGPSALEITQNIVNSLNSNYKEYQAVREASEFLIASASKLSDPKDLRPSHRDMNPYNLLFDGNDYFLVDWEAAAQDNLYYDLATCMNYYFYEDADRARDFLEQYFRDEPTEEQKYKLHLMQIVAFIYAGAGFLSLAQRSQQKLLSTEEITNLPSYAEFMKLIASSKKNLADPSVQQEYGFVCLAEAQKLL